MKTAVIIPAYNPDEQLKILADELKENGFDILVVDDGSDEACLKYFEDLPAEVIHNPKNLGKGAALKNGMRVLREIYPDADNFITADADGQHPVSDIIRVKEELERGHDFVITTRILKHAKTPLKSRIGNALSRFFVCIANNHYLPDNQSGLRGFDVKHIDWMLTVRGDKYDYELTVLLIAEKQGIRAKRVPIEAVYFNNNANTHFKPLIDTLRIYKNFFLTEIFAVIASVLAIVLVLVSDIIYGYQHMFWTILIAWGCHAILCFVVERYTLFRHIKYTPGVRRLLFSIFRYAIYWLICFAIKSFLGWPFTVAFIIAMLLTAIMEFYLLKVAYDN
ncbi:MAG: glycosyltransferase family 2 protein [Lachnospiraceae bacterium]|nr:glycosyltransferase family 2 protein [Lachnospiraceae bacterium]